MLKCQKIDPFVRIELDNKIVDHPPSIAEEVAKIWDEEKKIRGNSLYDGDIVSFSSVTGSIVSANIVRYRDYFAQSRDSKLFEYLRIQPLAVSGVTHFDGRFAIGKRSCEVNQDKEKWELVPSGGIAFSIASQHPHDVIRAQILEEASEELGLTEPMISATFPFLMIEDTDSKVVDIGIDVQLSGTMEDILSAGHNRSSEYSDILWLRAEELAQFCRATDHSAISEVSLALLKFKGLLN